MEWSWLLLLLVASFLDPSQAQELQPEDKDGDAVPIWGLATAIHGGGSGLCNKTFADANATALYSINPNVAQGPQEGQPDNISGQTEDVGLAITIQNPGFSNTSNGSATYSLWYNTNGANYSNDYALGYDVCALAGYSFNYNTQLRGQDDDGTCSSALDEPCISAIKATVGQWATWLTTASPGPNSNLTNTSLPGVCRSLSHSLVENMPTACSYFFQEKLDGLAWPLTSFGNNFQTGLFPDCTINGTYQNALSFYNNGSKAIYDAWVYAVTPIIFVFMPIADAGAQTTITETVVKVGCGHINHIKEGSFSPPAAPKATPVHYNATSHTSNNTTSNDQGNSRHGNLPAGAIAGIVVGVVVFALLCAGLGFWFWRKKRAASHKNGATQRQRMAEVPGDTTRFELGGQSVGAQSGSNEVAELGGNVVGELEGELEKKSGYTTHFELEGNGVRGQLPDMGENELGELEGKQAKNSVELPA